MKPITTESTNRFAALVYGEPGMGKTSLLRTIPEGQRACVLSAESGLLCVRDLVTSQRVEGFELASFDDLRTAYEQLQTKEFKERYQWVFLDSLTEIGQRCIEGLKESGRYSEKDAFKLWGEYGEKMTAMVKAFRDARDFSVVMSALAKAESDDLGRRFIKPDLQGRIGERLPALFDLVFYMDVEKVEGEDTRVFITSPTDTSRGHVVAKDRSGKLNQVEKPDLTHIFSKIMEETNAN